MNRKECIKTFLISVAAIEVYRLLTYVVEQVKYKQDDIDVPPKDFNEFDHIHLNAEVSD
ncbi:hypothetical protein [Staphylococcus epidermidis]|uniref:hypothetical protein n=1 Tax=Staphylococcus epidermidis TaxID=1282 RepID=UPI00287AD1EF|nr:hypothetical protein [Staphylococcus epidermidis]MDS3947891.1 hypothetical protein [Staphylococcus epidermidis]